MKPFSTRMTAAGKITAGLLAGSITLGAVDFAAGATLDGARGLLSVPSAQVHPARTIVLGATSHDSEQDLDPDASWTWTTLTAGIGFGGRGEAGIIYAIRTGGRTVDSFGVLGKALVVPEGPLVPAISLGADGIGDDIETTQAYVVSTKRFNPEQPLGSVTATFGGIYAWDRDGIRTEDVDVYGGLELGLGARFKLAGEWREQTNGFLHAGYGAMVVYGVDRYEVGAGILNEGNSEGEGFFISAGLSISMLTSSE